MTDEPAEQTCPHCDEPVGSRATYCMHCGRDLPDPGADGGPVEYDDPAAMRDTSEGDGALLERVTSRVRSVAGGDAATVDAGYDERTDAWDDEEGADEEWATSDAAQATGGERTADGERSLTRDSRVPSPDGSDGPRLLSLDGWPDASLSVVAAVVGGLLAGVASLFALGVPLHEAGVWLSVLAWLGSTAYLGRQRSVYDAVRYGVYGLAILMVFVPFGLAISAEGGPSARAVALAVMLVPVGVVALIVTGIGHSARRVPE